MDIVYLYIGGSAKQTSVQKKVVCQIHEMNKNGVSARGFFYSNEVKQEEKLDEYISLKPIPTYTKQHRFFHKRHKSAFDAAYIFNDLKKHKFDYLFVRYGSPTLSMFKLLKFFGKKTLLYIPSNIISEPYQEAKHDKFNSVASWVLKWIDYFVFSYLFNYYLYLFVLPKLKSAVAFTPEFANMIKKKSLNRATVIYNRDGVDTKAVTPRTYTPSDGAYKLIFLKGSAVQQPWAGLERLVKSIAACPDLKFELYITGRVLNEEDFNYPFVKLTGRLSDEDLEKLINSMDIGVSNLANYMIGFNETTNMKSRDYFARSLPFVQSNTMPDVIGTKAEKYYLLVENNSSLIDMDKVANFIKDMKSDANHIKEMSSFAQEKLDWNITVKELVKSIKELN
jgi:glycosyltransferase involved in cell wall biosynthesis